MFSNSSPQFSFSAKAQSQIQEENSAETALTAGSGHAKKTLKTGRGSGGDGLRAQEPTASAEENFVLCADYASRASLGLQPQPKC